MVPGTTNCLRYISIIEYLFSCKRTKKKNEAWTISFVLEPYFDQPVQGKIHVLFFMHYLSKYTSMPRLMLEKKDPSCKMNNGIAY